MGKKPPTLEQPVERRGMGGDAASWLLCGYLILIVAGILMLREPGVMPEGNALSPSRSFFMAVNAATLTGFQVRVEAFSENSLQGPAILLILTYAGILVNYVVGGAAVVRILRLPYSTGRLIGVSLLACLATLVIGTALAIAEPGELSSRVLLDGWQNVASALGNSGVIGTARPSLMAWQTHLIFMPLAMLGGLGLPVLLEIWDRVRGRRELSRHGSTMLTLTAALYLAAVACFVLMRLPRFEFLGAMGDEDFRRTLASSSVAAVNSRSCGMPIEYAYQWPVLMRWLVVVLMLVGGASAGTAGGLRLNTLVHLFHGVRRTMRGESPGRPFAIALLWTAGYVVVAAAAFVYLSSIGQRQWPAERLLFDTISAIGNVGLSEDRIAMVGTELSILGGLALFGRVAPLMVLWWMAETTTDADMPVA